MNRLLVGLQEITPTKTGQQCVSPRHGKALEEILPYKESITQTLRIPSGSPICASASRMVFIFKSIITI